MMTENYFYHLFTTQITASVIIKPKKKSFDDNFLVSHYFSNTILYVSIG